jgi:hypothetical protein
LNVQFQECNWSDFYIYLELEEIPGEAQKQYLEQVFDAWYTLGLLGGYNATAFQIQDSNVEDISYLEYKNDQDQLPSLMHNMGSFEYEGNWARCWFDLGTTDAVALDVVLNALATLSVEYVPVEKVILSSVAVEGWPTNESLENQGESRWN